MKIYKKNYSSKCLEKLTSTSKSTKTILIPKIIMNDPFKNKIRQNNINQAKLPSIKCISTKNSSKYDIKDFEGISIYKNRSKNNNKDSNQKMIYPYNVKVKDIKDQIKNDTNKDYFKNFSQDYVFEDNLKNKLKKSSSAIFSEDSCKLFSKYKVFNIFNFHKNLMAKNKLTFDRTLKNKFFQMINEQNKKNDYYINSLFEDKNKKNIKTGIFGPSNNIVSVIRAKMERLKYDNIYKGVNEDIKELIKDEIMDAQVKLKREPQNLIVNKNGIRPLYIKKMDQYRYLSSMNKIRELNQLSNIPVLEKDKNIMLRLFNDAFDILRNKRGKNS